LKPQAPKPISWNVASKAVRVGEIQVPDKAIEKSAAEFKVRPADGDTAMARREGEITSDDLKHWPHHLALPPTRCGICEA
jgi:hypothetical protein